MLIVHYSNHENGYKVASLFPIPVDVYGVEKGDRFGVAGEKSIIE